MKKIAFLVTGFVLLFGIAFANQYELKFSGEVDTTISDIATGGLWRQNNRFGNWRLIVRNLGWEHTRSFLYLQWLENDDENKKIFEIKTVPIVEFNDSDWRNVNRIEYKNNSFVIWHTIRAKEETGMHSAIILPGLPDEYKINIK